MMVYVTLTWMQVFLPKFADFLITAFNLFAIFALANIANESYRKKSSHV